MADDKILAYWESLSWNSLQTTSLSTLSKTLPPDVNDDMVFDLYLLWLNTHRANETSMTTHWQNTLLHWSQSLRSRGYSEARICREVDKWRDEDRGREGYPRARDMPWHEDIARAFEGDPRKHHESESSNRDAGKGKVDRAPQDDVLEANKIEKKSKATTSEPSSKSSAHQRESSTKDTAFMEKYDGPPPTNYVCNRCKKKGHHLQVCPTNLDPKYDTLPNKDYMCDVCKSIGKHYKSLCPWNLDPKSIIQKRKAMALKEALPAKRNIDLITGRDIDRDRDHQKRLKKWKAEAGRLERQSIEVGERLDETTERTYTAQVASTKMKQDIDNKINRKLSVSSDKAQSKKAASVSANGCQKKSVLDSNWKASEFHNSLVDFGRLSFDNGPNEKVSQEKPAQRKVEFDKRVIVRLIEPRNESDNGRLSPKTAQEDFEMDLQITSEDITTVTPESFADGTNKKTGMFNFQMYDADTRNPASTSDTSSDEGDISSSPPRTKTHSTFVRMLMAKFPKMSDVVHPPVPRPTALQMWKVTASVE